MTGPARVLPSRAMNTNRQDHAGTTGGPDPALIAALDEAIRGHACPELTTRLQQTLCRLIREQRLHLPAAVFEAHPEHYARRQIYRSPDLGYTVIAMTWGPGQGTPVHDHSGLWCVEGVVAGALQITQYELVERQDEQVRFQDCGTLAAGIGSAGSLIPPHEYHAIRNASDRDIAVSLHIYGGEMTSCCTFVPVQGDWYRRCPKALQLD
jgi:predicted metal-dependent enzyme (double-stranded beta helix superfamily)